MIIVCLERCNRRRQRAIVAIFAALKTRIACILPIFINENVSSRRLFCVKRFPSARSEWRLLPTERDQVQARKTYGPQQLVIRSPAVRFAKGLHGVARRVSARCTARDRKIPLYIRTRCCARLLGARPRQECLRSATRAERLQVLQDQQAVNFGGESVFLGASGGARELTHQACRLCGEQAVRMPFRVVVTDLSIRS